jgi:Flp pilus assembly pilin Flp
MRQKKGQSLVEYTIIASLIAIVLATMGPAFRRSVQQVVKSVADNIGFQAESEQASDPDAGFVNTQLSTSQTASSTDIRERGGNYFASETQQANMQSLTNTNGAFVEQ